MSPRIQVQHSRCPYCHAGIEPGAEKAACHDCMAWHHAACWEEHGSCAACRSPERLVLRRLDDTGRTCPSCDGTLAPHEYDGVRVELCEACWATWIPQGSLGRLVLSMLSDAASPGEPEPQGPHVEAPVPCFDCQAPMLKWVWRDLIVDCCPGHGLWLASGELLRLRQLAERYPTECYQLLSQLLEQE